LLKCVIEIYWKFVRLDLLTPCDVIGVLQDAADNVFCPCSLIGCFVLTGNCPRFCLTIDCKELYGN